MNMCESIYMNMYDSTITSYHIICTGIWQRTRHCTVCTYPYRTVLLHYCCLLYMLECKGWQQNTHLVDDSFLKKHDLGNMLVVYTERRVDLLQHVAMPRQQLHGSGVITMFLGVGACHTGVPLRVIRQLYRFCFAEFTRLNPPDLATAIHIALHSFLDPPGPSYKHLSNSSVRCCVCGVRRDLWCWIDTKRNWNRQIFAVWASPCFFSKVSTCFFQKRGEQRAMHIPYSTPCKQQYSNTTVVSEDGRWKMAAWALEPEVIWT